MGMFARHHAMSMHADVGKVLVVKPCVLLSFICKGSNVAWILLLCLPMLNHYLLKGRAS